MEKKTTKKAKNMGQLKVTYVRSVIGGIMCVINKRNMSLEDIKSGSTYIYKIGNKNEDKGENTLVYFHRLLDSGTKKILKVDDMFKIEKNLKLLEQGYEYQVISEDLKLYRYIVNSGDTIINCDPSRKYYQIINDTIGAKEYKSSKGIINRLWDLYR